MAVDDFGGKVLDKPIEVISADHQNKPDIASNIVNQWIDQDGVDMITDVPTSSVALAIQEITKNKNRVHINSGAATSDLTGAKCSPTGIHWTYDTYALANGTGATLVKEGGDTWFFITADYAFGHALRARHHRGHRKGRAARCSARSAIPSRARRTSRPSCCRRKAQAPRSSASPMPALDTVNTIKQAGEFGIVAGGQRLAGLLVFLTDVKSLGLKTAQGLVITTGFYWDLNDETRAFAKKFAAKNDGKMPTMVQAGVYSGTMHYLKAIKAAEHRRGQGCRRQDEGNAGQRLLRQERQDPRGWPAWCTTCIWRR